MYLSSPTGNNAFSYQERIALGSTGKIFVPSLKQGSGADLEIGSEIVFEEVIDGKLVSCVGLKNHIQTMYHDIPVFIVDNHNHALKFRQEGDKGGPMTLIHIDQHSDAAILVNEETNVGNFITAAVKSGIVDNVIQIRSDYALKHFNFQNILNFPNIIVDIDMDFRVEKENIESDFEIVREIMKQAKIITIATSPYFMDQTQAISLIKQLLHE